MPNPDLTPFQKAKNIIESPTDRSYGDGERIVNVLLAGRRMEDLSLEELQLLFRGYNWWGKHEESFEAARQGLLKDPCNMSLLQDAALAIRNCTAGSNYAAESKMSWFDRCIDEKIGFPAFWHIQRAVEYYDLATQPPNCEDFIDWSKGDPIYDPKSLDLALAELRQAVALDPSLKQEKENWLGGAWDDYFAALLEVPKYRSLMGR